MSNTERQTMTTAGKIAGWIVVGSLILFNDLLKLVAYATYTGVTAVVDWLAPL